MNKENDLRHYLSISANKFGIYLFDTKNLENLYEKEITLNHDIDFLNYDLLKKFLDDNVFKIEKYNGKFIDNIILILHRQSLNFFHCSFLKIDINNLSFLVLSYQVTLIKYYFLV